MVQIIVTNESYLGANNGAVNITPQFGIAPYTYLWSNGSTSEDIVGLSPALYSCVITDSDSNEVTIQATVTAGLPELVVTLDIASSECPNGRGIVTVTATGGTGTYEYTWSDETGIIGGSFDGSFDQSFPTTFPNVASFLEGYYTVIVTSGTQTQIVEFYVDSPLNYIFYSQVITPATTPLSLATVYYKFVNATDINISNETVTINQTAVDNIIEGNVQIPVGTSEFTGTWTPIGSTSNVCSMRVVMLGTTDYACNDYKIVDFDLNVTAQTLYVTFEGEVGQSYYRINVNDWIPFTAPFTITNLPFGVNDIQFRNEAGCIIRRRIKAYKIEPFEQNDSLTISYTSNKSKWASFHSYSPRTLVQVNDKLIALDETIEEHNLGNTGEFYGTTFRSILDLVFRASEDVIWSFFQWNNIVTERNGVYLYDETIDYITIRNLFQTSGKIELEKRHNIIVYKEEYLYTSLLASFWHFNKFYDRANVNQFTTRNLYQNYDTIESNLYSPDTLDHELHRMISDFIIVRLEESNERKLKFKINDVIANVIKRYR